MDQDPRMDIGTRKAYLHIIAYLLITDMNLTDVERAFLFRVSNRLGLTDDDCREVMAHTNMSQDIGSLARSLSPAMQQDLIDDLCHVGKQDPVIDDNHYIIELLKELLRGAGEVHRLSKEHKVVSPTPQPQPQSSGGQYELLETLLVSGVELFLNQLGPQASEQFYTRTLRLLTEWYERNLSTASRK